MKHVKKTLIALTVTLVVLASALAYMASSRWARAKHLIRDLEANPRLEISHADYDLLMRYFSNQIWVRAPWDHWNRNEEKRFIAAALERCEIPGHTYILLIVISRRHFWGDFDDLPNMSRAFLQRQDAAAADVLSYMETASPGILLDRAFLTDLDWTRGVDKSLQITIITLSSRDLILANADLYRRMLESGRLYPPARATLREKMHYFGITAQVLGPTTAPESGRE